MLVQMGEEAGDEHLARTLEVEAVVNPIHLVDILEDEVEVANAVFLPLRFQHQQKIFLLRAFSRAYPEISRQI